MILLRYAVKRITFSHIPCRSFCSDVSIHENVTSSTIRKPLQEKRGADIYDYLKNRNAEDLYAKIPPHFIEKRKYWKPLLINPLIAKRIACALKLYLNDGYVLESDPGFGLISEELITFVSHLILCEEDVNLRMNLKHYNALNNTNILNQSLLQIHRIQRNDNINNHTQMTEMFDRIPAETTVNLFIMLPNKIYIFNWFRHLISKEYFSKFDGLEFYFLIPPSIYTRLVATPSNPYRPRYQSFSVLAQVLFDIELMIEDIPRKAFLPWPSKKKAGQRHKDVQRFENDDEMLFLVRMRLRKDSLCEFPDDDLFRCFLFFINEVARGKKRIIPYFEKLIPGSGARLIVKGYTIYTCFNELEPMELFSIFKEFIKYPEFENTAFYIYLKSIMNTEENLDISDSSSSGLLHDISNEDDEDEAFLPDNEVK